MPRAGHSYSSRALCAVVTMMLKSTEMHLGVIGEEEEEKRHKKN